MNNTEKLIQEPVKRKKGHWALRIFLLGIFLAFCFFVSYAFRDASGEVNRSHLYLLPVILLMLLGLNSVSLYRKSNRGGKVYGIFDLFVTLIIPFLILFVLLK